MGTKQLQKATQKKATQKAAAATTPEAVEAPAVDRSNKALLRLVGQVRITKKGTPKAPSGKWWVLATREVLAAWSDWCDMRAALDAALCDFIKHAPGIGCHVGGKHTNAKEVRAALRGEEKGLLKAIDAGDFGA